MILYTQKACPYIRHGYRIFFSRNKFCRSKGWVLRPGRPLVCRRGDSDHAVCKRKPPDVFRRKLPVKFFINFPLHLFLVSLSLPIT